jgi:hypothetical protein
LCRGAALDETTATLRPSEEEEQEEPLEAGKAGLEPVSEHNSAFDSPAVKGF